MSKIKGLSIRRSYHPVKETINILQEYLQQHGATIYARIDQQAEAGKVGQHLLPLQFLLFGNPKGGVPAIQRNPLTALDLPLKIVVWEDEKQKKWIAYNKSGYIRKRYELPATFDSPFNIELLLDAALPLQQPEIKTKKLNK
jgi:uncharacterized protein (DUF302 family)